MLATVQGVRLDDDEEVLAHRPKTQTEPARKPTHRAVPFREKEESLFVIAHRWMDEHPETMALFEKLALQAAARGRKFGIALLTERVRWEYTVEMDQPSDTYKICNNHRAYIARELIKRHPHLGDFIEIRRVQDGGEMPF